MFQQSCVPVMLFYAIICWGSSTKKMDPTQRDRLVRRVSSVAGIELEPITSVSVIRTLNKSALCAHSVPETHELV